MKKRLEEFVSRNRDAFDDQEPSEKNWRGIEDHLPLMKSRSVLNSVSLWRAAAIILFGVSSFLFFTRPSVVQKKEAAIASTEFNDLESFYSGQIAEKVAWINEADAMGENDPFTQDFQKLDAMYQVLREEMKNHPSLKVKDALVLNLLVRIDLLNQQMKKLEDNRKSTGKTDVIV